MEIPVIKVLYIDDEAHNLTAFKASFRRVFSVFTAESAEQAGHILEQNDIHVILSDQRMPKMTGIEFFESILTKFPDPIRILITGYTDISAVIDAINRGQVYKYLTKPWNEDEVKNFITKAFEVYQLRKENVHLTEKLIDVNQKLELIARHAILS
ncbi:response regulator [Foetidibacter luteolus]|uniref:response regulator n=1 Tax=Foetidibacter luteolus TaxID=2608880 RepID=UPI00129B2870|nr:response regulator [Foetidibacter luteolus]